MISRIDWTPTTPALHKINQDLVHRGRHWPKPAASSPLITAAHLTLAKEQWAQRLRAIYLTTAHAAHLLHRLMIIGAPLDLISGTSYTADELGRHLNLTAHIFRAIHPSDELTFQSDLFPTRADRPSWHHLFEKTLELFAFNLTLSYPVQQAIGAITSDGAIAELAQVQAKSLEELLDFGQAALQWMTRKLTDQQARSIEQRLPTLLAAFEELCQGSPLRLDALAGKEIILDAQTGNMGTLTPEQLAASFYHTLNYSIFPTLHDLGWDGMKAWQEHHLVDVSAIQYQAVVAAIGAS